MFINVQSRNLMEIWTLRREIRDFDFVETSTKTILHQLEQPGFFESEGTTKNLYPSLLKNILS